MFDMSRIIMSRIHPIFARSLHGDLRGRSLAAAPCGGAAAAQSKSLGRLRRLVDRQPEYETGGRRTNNAAVPTRREWRRRGRRRRGRRWRGRQWRERRLTADCGRERRGSAPPPLALPRRARLTGKIHATDARSVACDVTLHGFENEAEHAADALRASDAATAAALAEVSVFLDREIEALGGST